MAISTQDFIKGEDFTSRQTVSATRLNQHVDLATPGADRGLIVYGEKDEPVPDADVVVKYKRYIYARNVQPGLELYIWDDDMVIPPATPKTPTPALLKWRLIASTNGVPKNSIDGEAIKDGSLSLGKLDPNSIGFGLAISNKKLSVKLSVDTIADLKALPDRDIPDQTIVYVVRYSTDDTKNLGGGFFILDKTDVGTLEDGGSLISAAVGMWKRIVIGDPRVEMFGGFPIPTSSDTNIVNDATQACLSAYNACYFDSGTYLIEYESNPAGPAINENASIISTNNDTRIVGNGNTVLQFKTDYSISAATAKQYMFIISGDNILVEGITFDINYSRISNNNGHINLAALRFDGSNIRVNNIKVINFNSPYGGAESFAVYLVASPPGSNAKITNCVFSGMADHLENNTGSRIPEVSWLAVEGPYTDVEISNCTFRDITNTSDRLNKNHLITCVDVDGLRIIDNTVLNVDGIFFYQDNRGNENVLIANNICKNLSSFVTVSNLFAISDYVNNDTRRFGQIKNFSVTGNTVVLAHSQTALTDITAPNYGGYDAHYGVAFFYSRHEYQTESFLDGLYISDNVFYYTKPASVAAAYARGVLIKDGSSGTQDTYEPTKNVRIVNNIFNFPVTPDITSIENNPSKSNVPPLETYDYRVLGWWGADNINVTHEKDVDQIIQLHNNFMPNGKPVRLWAFYEDAGTGGWKNYIKAVIYDQDKRRTRNEDITLEEMGYITYEVARSGVPLRLVDTYTSTDPIEQPHKLKNAIEDQLEYADATGHYYTFLYGAHQDTTRDEFYGGKARQCKYVLDFPEASKIVHIVLPQVEVFGPSRTGDLWHNITHVPYRLELEFFVKRILSQVYFWAYTQNSNFKHVWPPASENSPVTEGKLPLQASIDPKKPWQYQFTFKFICETHDDTAGFDGARWFGYWPRTP